MAATMVKVGPIILRTTDNTVHYQGRECYLPPRHFELLLVLAESKNKVVPKTKVYRRLYPHGGVSSEILDTLISQIRAKLKRGLRGTIGRHLLTIWGQGYRLSSTPMEMIEVDRTRTGITQALKQLE